MYNFQKVTFKDGRKLDYPFLKKYLFIFGHTSQFVGS